MHAFMLMTYFLLRTITICSKKIKKKIQACYVQRVQNDQLWTNVLGIEVRQLPDGIFISQKNLRELTEKFRMSKCNAVYACINGLKIDKEKEKEVLLAEHCSKV